MSCSLPKYRFPDIEHDPRHVYQAVHDELMLGGDMPTFALNFSSPGGQVAVQYYNFLRLGKEGYRRIHNACYKTAQFIAKQIADMGLFEIIYNGAGGIPALSWSLKKGVNSGFTLYDLSDRLRARGWQVAAYSMPPHREDLVIMRILVRHGVSRDLGQMLVNDMRACMEHFKKNPVTKPLESAGYSH